MLFALFLATRLGNLTIIPLFNDEANYIYWAKIIAETGKGWFITLTTGKPPVFLWLMVPFLRVLPAKEYLLAARLPTVLSGMIGFWGIYQLTLLLFQSKRMATVAALFYVLCPFILLYDRLAMFDSQLSAMLVWTVYSIVKTARTFQVKHAVMMGFFWGMALLSKPTAILFFGMAPIIFFLQIDRKELAKKFWRVVNLVLVAFVIAFLLHGFLAVSTGFPLYLQRALEYTHNPSIAYTPSRMTIFLTNIADSVRWMWNFYTWPVFMLGACGLLFLGVRYRRTGLSLLALWAVPTLILAFFGGIYFPRYFLFTTPYFLIAGAWFFSFIISGKRLLGLLLLLGVLLPAAKYDLALLTDPPAAPLPQLESWQYVTGYPNTYGFEPIYQYLDKQLQNGPVTLFVQGSFSHFPHAFDLYYWGNKSVRIIEIWPLTALSMDMFEAEKTSQVFLVLRHNHMEPESDILEVLPVEVVVEGKKPGGLDSVYLAKLPI